MCRCNTKWLRSFK